MTEQTVESKPYPWDVAGRFKSFTEADNLRNSIAEKNDTVQVKVRKLSECFVVKTRALPEFRTKSNSKKTKKKGKKRKSSDE
jgi:hypothetical protein